MLSMPGPIKAFGRDVRQLEERSIDPEQIVSEVEAELSEVAEMQGTPFNSSNVQEAARLAVEKVFNRLQNPSTEGGA